MNGGRIANLQSSVNDASGVYIPAQLESCTCHRLGLAFSTTHLCLFHVLDHFFNSIELNRLLHNYQSLRTKQLKRREQNGIKMPDAAQINRSLSTIRTELEFLQQSGVLSPPQFQSIMAQLPVYPISLPLLLSIPYSLLSWFFHGGNPQSANLAVLEASSSKREISRDWKEMVVLTR